MADEQPLLCQRCGRELTPGRGDFYVVRIEAFADPTPPTISEADLATDFQEEMIHLADEMRGMSEQELQDQVYRKLIICLCGACYRGWIENPA